MPRTNRTDEKKRAKFLAALCEGASISKACRVAVLPRRTVYDWRGTVTGFAEAWDEALEVGTDLLEDEATRRAQKGVDRPVFYQGKKVAQVREYSDTLLIFLLKARRPEKFKDRHELTGKNGAPVVVEVVRFADKAAGE